MIERRIFHELASHLSQNEISLIVGPRQAGKTTAMRWLQEHAKGLGAKTVFLDLDVEAHRPHFESQQALLNKLRMEFGPERGVAFIDEIQRKEDAGLFLKGIYDQRLPYKLVVSGSGSLELKERIHESLVGRKRLFELPTLTFVEFASFRTEYQYQDRLREFFELEKQRVEALFFEYLNYGGYPRVVTSPTSEEKNRTLDEIYRSYLERDVMALLRVEKTESFSRMIRLLAHQVGQLMNYSELAALLHVAVPTLKTYLWNAEKTFIVGLATPYFTNPQKELTKSPTCYFHDLGLRNYAAGVHGTLAQEANLGPLFQNFVWRLLWEGTRFGPTTIHFWRTKDKAEVDFVLETGPRVIPVEVKFREMRQPEIGRSLRSFIARYQPGQAWIVNRTLEAETTINSTRVKWVPFHRLLWGWEGWQAVAGTGQQGV